MTSGEKAKKQQQKKRPAGNNRPAVSLVKQRAMPLRDTLLALALIIVIGLLTYANTFDAPFVLDDECNILDNPFIRVTHITAGELKGVLKSHDTFRPLPNLTLALNYYFHQYDVTGYHIVNMTIHLFTAFLVFLITRQTLILCQYGNIWIAIPAALLWLVNPVHTQSVTYIVQRMNALAAMFYLLAMVCYIRGRLLQRRDAKTSLRPMLMFAASALAGFLGLISKEITVTLPVMMFMYEWYFFQDLDMGWLKKQARWIIALSVVMAAVALIYLKGNPWAEIASQYARKNFTLTQRLLTEPGVVLYYLSLLFFPSPDRLRIIYHLSPATSLLSPATSLLSFVSQAGLIAAALVMRRRNRLVSFAIVWFLVTLVIESSIIPLALAFEHRTYLPSAFLFTALTGLLFTNTTFRKASAVIGAAIILCGFWTWQRNAVWTDKFTFWNDAVMKAPGDPGALNNLGMACGEKGELETALTHFKASLEQNTNYEKAYNNIGITLIDLNRTAEAVPYLKRAISLKPDFDDAYHNLGLALYKMKQPEEAEGYYRRALELNPLHAKAHNNLGTILMQRGQNDLAAEHFQKAVKVNPLYAKAHNNLGIILMQRGQNDLASAHFQKAVAINPNLANPYNSLGIACFRKGATDQAMTYFKKALALKPDYTEAAGNLDRMTRVLEEHGQTIARLQQARRQRPNDPEIACQLAQVCRQAGMADLAANLYEEALSLGPECGK